MIVPSMGVVEALRRRFPVGSRVILDYMADPYKGMTAGMLGTVRHVDDIGTIHVRWDEGFSLGVCYGEDKCHRVNEDG